MVPHGICARYTNSNHECALSFGSCVCVCVCVCVLYTYLWHLS
jgi:hypothetical protein